MLPLLLLACAAADADDSAADDTGTTPLTPTPDRLFVGGETVCVLGDDGTIACSGSDAPPAGTYTAIVGGAGFGLAQGADGVTPWGMDTWMAPLALPGDVHGLAAGGATGLAAAACALDADEAVVCSRSFTSAFATPTGRYTAVGTSGSHVCAVADGSGAVVCAGDAPLIPPTDPLATVAVALSENLGGEAHACGLRPDGTIACFGDDGEGQTRAPEGTWVEVKVATGLSCALAASGVVRCWGDDGAGQASPPEGTRFTTIAVDPEYGCGLGPDGLRCWGRVPELP